MVKQIVTDLGFVKHDQQIDNNGDTMHAELCENNIIVVKQQLYGANNVAITTAFTALK